MNLSQLSTVIACLLFALSFGACNRKPHPNLPPDAPVSEHAKSEKKSAKNGVEKGTKAKGKKGKKKGKAKETLSPKAATPVPQ